MSKDKIRKAIQEISKTGDEVYSIVCTVDSVDLTKKTCDCTPIDGKADLLGVRLMAESSTGYFITPKVNSVVVVTMINGFTGYVAMFSEIDEIQLNGNVNGGIIKITEQTAKLNQLVAQVQAQLALISTAIGLVGGSYVPGVLSTFVKTDYENTTVKNGNG